MKERSLYIFYSDEDVVTGLRNKLNIKDSLDVDQFGNFEVSKAPFETQLKEAKWSEIGTGRYTVLYYVTCYDVEDDDGEMIPSINISNAHIIVKHDTKDEVQEKNADKITKALTILEETDII